MSKPILAFVVLAACMASAHAQSPAAVYGLESAAAGERSCDVCPTIKISSTVVPGARLGFRGRGELGGGLADVFGLDGGILDDRDRYFVRNPRGVSANASYGLTDLPGDPEANRVWGMSVGIERGRWAFRVAHQNKNVARVAPSMALGNNMDAKNTIVAANVKLGPAIAYAAYSANRGWGSSPLWNPDNPYSASFSTTPSTDSRDVLLGVAVPRGATTFLASFIRKNDRDLANRDADQFALGATYALSRRTDFYAAYSLIKNRNGARYPVGNATEASRGSSALNVGMRHAF